MYTRASSKWCSDGGVGGCYTYKLKPNTLLRG